VHGASPATWADTLPSSARRIEDGFSQLPPQSKAAKGFAHIQPLHFGSVRIVDVVDGPQGAAAGHLAFDQGQQQGDAQAKQVNQQSRHAHQGGLFKRQAGKQPDPCFVSAQTGGTLNRQQGRDFAP
jgi:hypothetical protein